VEDVDRDRALAYAHPPADPAPDDRTPQAPAERRHQSFVGGGEPFPELLDPEIAGDRDEPVKMVGMGVREDQRVDPLDALAPEDGRNDPLPHVERAPGQASAVDEHDPASGELDQDGLALSDVDECDHKFRGGRPEGRGDENENGQKKERHDGRALAPETGPGQREPEGDEIAREDGRRRRRDAEGEERDLRVRP
jgi:hypothetical protein